jgi:hypothetical protein
VTRRRCWAPFVACLLALSPRQAAAEPPATTVLVVVEGAPAATGLRARLARQFGPKLVSLTQIAERGVAPAAVLSVKYGPHAALAVSYLDRMGRAEVLSVEAPRAGAAEDVAFGLAAALLARYLPAFATGANSAVSAASSASMEAAAYSLLARDWGWTPSGPRFARLHLSIDDF